MDSMEMANDRVSDLIADKDPIFSAGSARPSLRRIIDGEVYSAQNASLKAQFCCGCESGYEQYMHFMEDLYQTENGKFFLIGEGLTEYTPWCAKIPGTSEYGRGHALVPLSEDDAKRWLEIRCLDEAYEEIFGLAGETSELEESTGDAEIMLPLQQALACLVKDEATAANQSVYEYIQDAIEQKLASAK